MRRAVQILVVLAVLVGSAAAVRAEEIPLEKIQAAIAAGVEKILATQRADGCFVLHERYMKEYPLGSTGLELLALEYARPHLKGDLLGRASEAMRKGFAYLVQSPLDQKTYSAGFILSALYKEAPERYRKTIDLYAAMLVVSQSDTGDLSGQWGYDLRMPPGVQDNSKATMGMGRWGDNSNNQLALLGLYCADRAGFQVPKKVWLRSRDHYLRTQALDGGWGYNATSRPEPYANMTIASTISLNLCEEMLFEGKHEQCIPPMRSRPVESGLKWIDENWEKQKIGTDTYGLYALERLGILMGRASIVRHDWYNEGAQELLGGHGWSGFGCPVMATTCFGVMFLARGLEPIVINKLERRDTNDWNNDPYDVKHLVEYLTDHYQMAVQWRIVSLQAPLDLLLRTPILYISGHRKLEFDDAEKAKLKAYVAGGGTILGQACCSKKEFDQSFRAVMKEILGGELRPLPAGHRIYERMTTRGVTPKVTVEALLLDKEQGRPAVLYLPTDHCCRWQVGGSEATGAFAVGTGIYFYVAIEGRKMFESSHPAAPPAIPATPEPDVVPPPATPNPGAPPAAPQPNAL